MRVGEGWVGVDEFGSNGPRHCGGGGGGGNTRRGFAFACVGGMFRLALMTGMAGIGVGGSVYEYGVRERRKKAKSWPYVTGEVVGVSYDDHITLSFPGIGSWVPSLGMEEWHTVEYEYEVGGKKYASTQVQIEPIPGPWGAKTQAVFYAGREINVYCDPDAVEDSILLLTPRDSVSNVVAMNAPYVVAGISLLRLFLHVVK